MQIEILHDKKEKLSFLLKDSTPAFANALRRTIVDEVPTLAIETVEIRKNNSVLYDEIIAHRLGLVPLKTDLKGYTPIDKCTCSKEGCAKCQVTAVLKAKGPCTVYASELKFKDPAIKSVYPEMIIVKLLKNQELELEATAILGRGKEHAKWSPAHTFYKYNPVIEIKNVENPEAVAKVCPTKVFEVKGKKLVAANPQDCILCGACVDESSGQVKLNESDKDFIFFVESFGQLECAEIVAKAVEIVEEQLDEFEEKLK